MPAPAASLEKSDALKTSRRTRKEALTVLFLRTTSAFRNRSLECSAAFCEAGPRTPKVNMFLCRTLASQLSALFLGAALAAALPVNATEMQDLAATLHNAQFTERVEALLKQRRPAAALELADIGISRNSRNAQLYFLKSVALESLGRQEEAGRVLRSLIASYPEIPEPYNNLAVIEAGFGNLEEAAGLLRKALSINADFALAQKNLGDVYLALALEQYERAAPQLASNQTLQQRLKTLKRLTAK